MTFAADLARFQVKLVTRNREVLLGVTDGVHESIVNGSVLTGAAGQPVDTGYLKNSWQKEIAPDWQSSEIGTNVAYARVIEDGLKSSYDPRGETEPKYATTEGRSRRGPGGFGQRGGRIGPPLPSGDAINLRSLVGGFHSVKTTVANADAIVRDVVAKFGR
jgi:hypothetical protein